MALIHLPNTAPASEAIACIRENGYVIIDELASPQIMDGIQAELNPYIEATPFGKTETTGTRTRRTGSIVARSPTARSLIMNELVLQVCDAFLRSRTGYHLSLTEVITLSPGAQAQFIHRDDVGYGAYPFDPDYEVQISTLWAMSEYTEEMGATRVVPCSHRLGCNVKFDISDTVAAEMTRGSVIIYSGKLYHGGGENRSNRLRQALNIDYGAFWTRQEENQYLSCPAEIARTLPVDLLKMMGYQAVDAWGRVGDWGDPLSCLFGRQEQIHESTDLLEFYNEVAR